MPQAAVRDMFKEARQAAWQDNLQDNWQDTWQSSEQESWQQKEQDSWQQTKRDFCKKIQQSNLKDNQLNTLRDSVHDQVQQALEDKNQDTLKDLFEITSTPEAPTAPTKQQRRIARALRKSRTLGRELNYRAHHLTKGRCAWYIISATTSPSTLLDQPHPTAANPHIYLTTPTNDHYTLSPKPNHQILTDAKISLIRSIRDPLQKGLRERHQRQFLYHEQNVADMHSPAYQAAEKARNWWAQQQEEWAWCWWEQQRAETYVDLSLGRCLERGLEVKVVA